MYMKETNACVYTQKQCNWDMHNMAQKPHPGHVILCVCVGPYWQHIGPTSLCMLIECHKLEYTKADTPNLSVGLWAWTAISWCCNHMHPWSWDVTECRQFQHTRPQTWTCVPQYTGIGTMRPLPCSITSYIIPDLSCARGVALDAMALHAHLHNLPACRTMPAPL